VAILVLVALVLLIACLNLATLLLARGTARGRECAVRLALGASRWRLVRQQLVESLMLAGAGAVAGLLVAAWGSRALVAQLSDSVDRVFLNLSPDWRVAAFAGIVTITTAALCGFAPAWRATRAAPMVALKSRAIASRSGRGGLPGGLIVGQVALALMLVVMAGLFLRTFDQLTNLPLGFDSERLLVVRVDATRAHVSPAERTLFYDRLVSAVITVPGVAAAAVSMITPISGADMIERIEVPGVSPLQERTARINYVTPGWFATYATAVRAGRDIEKQDQRSTPRVFVVNDAFARAFLAGREPVGATVTNPVLERGQARIVKTVIGVVDNAVYRSLRDGVQPTVYAPLAQLRMTPAVISITVRASAGAPGLLARAVAAALTAADHDLALSVRPLSDQVRASLTQERLVAQLSGFLGLLALVLAAVGLYGITAHAVARRRGEIGIRIALGARRAGVISLVLRQTVALTALGILLGLAGAATVTGYIQAQLFGVTPLDVGTFATVGLLFGIVSALAAVVPARHAATVDPLIALRCE
jgi:predicted permease